MESKEVYKIPFIAHEAEIFEKKQKIKKLIVALVMTNAIFAATFMILYKKVVKSESRGLRTIPHGMGKHYR